MSAIFVSGPGYCGDDPDTGGRLRSAGYDLVLAPKLGPRSEAELSQLLTGCVGAVASTDPFSREVLLANPQLRVIARTGVGVDSIDMAAARELGIHVAITPGLNSETVADHALALMLALIRRVIPQDEGVRAGRWDRTGAHTPSEMPGKTVGVLGAGAIGKAVMRRLAGFGVRILFYDPAVRELNEAEKVNSIEDLFLQADILTLHAPLAEATSRVVNTRTLALMKPRAFLVNTARGGLVDEVALVEALRLGAIGGAALDVFQEEPPQAWRFADAPNLILSAHVAALSHESVRRMTIAATSNVLAVLAGDLGLATLSV